MTEEFIKRWLDYELPRLRRRDASNTDPLEEVRYPWRISTEPPQAARSVSPLTRGLQ